MNVRILAATSDQYELFILLDTKITWESLSATDRSKLEETHFNESHKLGLKKLILDTQSELFFAQNDIGDLLGFILIGNRYNTLTSKNEAWIYSIYVMPKIRKGGVGTQLLRFAEKYASDKKFHSIGLMVSSHNNDARRFYEKMNYQSTNVLLRKEI